MKCVFLFIFNPKIHKKVYEHNKVLHKHIKIFIYKRNNNET